jgi:hypothetical protein
MCAPTDVHVPVASAVTLGDVPVTKTKLLVDESQALYIAGTVASASVVDFGGGALPAGKGLVLVKLDAAQHHVWSRRFGSNFGIEGVSSFTFAANGDLLLAGITGFQTDLGGGPDPVSTAAQIYVARYDRNGTFVRRIILPATNSLPTLVKVMEAPSGDVLVFGNFTVPWTVGTTTLTQAGEADIFVLRFSAAGALLDAKRYGRARNDLVFDAVGAPDGSIYLLGFSYYAVDFGQNPINLGTDALSYVVRLDASLMPVWQKLVGSGGAYPRRAFLDGNTLVVAGDAYGGIYYGDSMTGALPSAHVFVFRIDSSNGTLLRGDTYEHKGFGAQVTALGRFAAGGLAIGGYLQPPADFGGGDIGGLKSHYQPFVARYDGSGQHVWSTAFCTTSLANDAIPGIAQGVGSPVLLASFSDNLELGSTRFSGRSGTALVDMPPDP